MSPAREPKDRLPPQSPEAEKAVLGSMLRDNGCIGDPIHILRTENFDSDARQHITTAHIDRYDTRYDGSAKSISGISTGYTDLDDLTAGLQNSELIVVAARPSVGKTAFAVNIIRNIILGERAAVFFVSLEQSRIELAERLL